VPSGWGPQRRRVDELLVFGSGWGGGVYLPLGEGWRRAGNFNVPGAQGRFDPAELERAQLLPPLWQDLQVQGQRLRVQIKP